MAWPVHVKYVRESQDQSELWIVKCAKQQNGLVGVKK